MRVLIGMGELLEAAALPADARSAQELSRSPSKKLTRNSFTGALLDGNAIARHLASIDAYAGADKATPGASP
jgi:hypothetical protein